MTTGDAILRGTAVGGCKFVARKIRKEFSAGQPPRRCLAYESDNERTMLDKK